MSDFPQLAVPPLFLSTLSLPWAATQEIRPAVSLAIASMAWPTASLATYVPFSIPFSYTVRRVFWVNGSSAGDNHDFGIYTSNGTRIYSTGPTAGSGASAPQFVTPATAFMLSPGTYYFAYVVDATTANRITGSSSPTLGLLRLAGVLQQGSAGTLPATATFAGATGLVYPTCGVTSTTTGF